MERDSREYEDLFCQSIDLHRATLNSCLESHSTILSTSKLQKTQCKPPSPQKQKLFRLGFCGVLQETPQEAPAQAASLPFDAKEAALAI